MRWGLILSVPVVAAGVALLAHPWGTPAAPAPPATPPAAAVETSQAKAAPAPTPAPTQSVVVPTCGAQLCRVPGTNVYAQPGTIYDPATGRTRAIPPLSPGYRAYLCRVEHVKCS